ncbi:2Fe-2S iron-sulfur cluster-binding protein [Streptomyces sp. DSM 44917]|uniref:2Fe-2S iron-sulfur cluster-binding protein n=1 Tax=Streptomyces boetiae TaxID=3075541 RepID=A0ABU2L8F6_9ACTN|nr:2Fe-2S iron-sulfur cluster-binding protein [Streptomyces sp. DSM 44917]MDT0307849.1 2Fe-2S iron-sulfur cluster-binding protein [Streptomyces sp. DSM 44917]
MSNDQRPEQDPPAPGPGGWGGEYDAEATAFIELPPGYQREAGEDPLAAPGHGYRPPVIEPPGSGTPPPAAATPTTDPGAAGQWTLPFAADPPATGSAAAMGQGAALAGRRPLGSGPPRAEGQDEPAWFADHGAAHREAGDGFPAVPAPWPGRDGGTPRRSLGEAGPHPAEPLPADAGGTWSTPADAGPWAAGPGAPVPEPAPGEVPSGLPAPGGSRSEHPEVSYVLRVNGVDRPVSGAWIGESLLYVLRERLGLAGAKDGCAQGECGACSVQVDGRLVAACLVPAATAAGSEIRTVEGLGGDGAPSDVQRALAATAVQCGFCLPGMAMTIHDLLEGNHAPTELETRQALCGNLCRCSGYRGALDAVRAVVEERAGKAAHGGHQAHPAPRAGEQAGQDGAARIPHQAGPPGGM